MGRVSICVAFVASLLANFTRPAAGSPDLSFEDRVRAQEAIERVYYSHQISASRSFHEAVPADHLQRKVMAYLRQSVALEKFWKTPITSEALRAELERMARATRFPDRLEELFHALRDDPVVIQECFARQVLAERLTRSFFGADERIQGPARHVAEELHRDLLSGRLSADDSHPLRKAIEVRRRRPDTGAPGIGRPHAPHLTELEEDEFARWRSSVPANAGDVSALEESSDEFMISVLLSEHPESVRLAVYNVPKVSWADWWDQSAGLWAWQDVRSVATPSSPLPLSSRSPASDAPDTSASTSSCDVHSEWTRSITDVPDRRTEHTAVWTGTLMLVWGGSFGNDPFLERGDRYDPLTDTWTSMSTVGAPQGRAEHTAIWTGTEMIVWGGRMDDEGYLSVNTGARYNPSTDSWIATSTVNAPSARFGHTAVWTGNRMIIWGGLYGQNTGGRYTPATDTWAAVATANAPTARTQHTAVWSGSVMVVWGGTDFVSFLSTGGRYDPGDNSWHPMTTVGAPAGRKSHTAVWTGSRMIVWGGAASSGVLDTGGRYNPATDVWGTISITGAPAARYLHTAVWNGDRMLVWGGWANGASNAGGGYIPGSNTWTSFSTVNAPSARYGHTAVWSGDLMIVFGGDTNTGGRYDPQADSWTPTSATGIPPPRYNHTAVWTGSLMIVWGGRGDSGPLNTGARYDPLADSWLPTAAPANLTSRQSHTAVWSGNEMIVWGGQGYDPATGDRYDPITDTWRSVSTTNAPYESDGPTAVWTGVEMLIWGGDWIGIEGGRYNPTTNSWRPTSTVNAPPGRTGHRAVWTGTEMIIWGGSCGQCYITGGRYNPVSDVWTATTTVNAPSPRTGHTAVWTGTEMIIWGGREDYVLLPDTGARYNPVTDTWAPSTIITSSLRSGHVAAWTGWSMTVWGGIGGAADRGGIYDPLLDTWTPTSPVDAPGFRTGHTGIWADRNMIIWGGSDGSEALSNGGLLSVRRGPDGDGDTFSICEGDCDDTNPGVYPGAAQVCGDGVNNDCDDLSWPDPGEADQDLDGLRGCEGDCDDTLVTVFPGAPQICDRRNNDCDDPVWPQVPVSESDADQDGLPICGGDCDDARVATHPGAVEVNDGSDNQCPGEPGYGAVDEISGLLTWLGGGGSYDLCWEPQWAASFYAVARSDVPSFAGGCLFELTNATCWTDPESPSPGGVFYYLVRSQIPNVGSWGQDSSGSVRANVCSGPGSVYSFTSLDGSGNDIADTGLSDFFTSVPAVPSSYLLFEVGAGPAGGAECSERADFHRDQYLAYGATRGIVVSGVWNKWYRGASGPWSGPSTIGFANYYGVDCYEPWAWCPDYRLGDLLLWIRPAGPDSCEIAKNDPPVCGDGTWRLSVRISVDRSRACGF